MNVIHMIYGVYTIQNFQQTEELKCLWIYVDGLEDEKNMLKHLEEPIMTIWWII